jgi:hypothetical protein
VLFLDLVDAITNLVPLAFNDADPVTERRDFALTVLGLERPLGAAVFRILPSACLGVDLTLKLLNLMV